MDGERMRTNGNSKGALGISKWRRSLRINRLSVFSINTQVIIQNRALSLARYLGLSADNHLDGQNGCQ